MKTILIDLDGVIIKGRHKYFSDKFSEEYNVPIESVMRFFKNEYGQTARGKLDIREALTKYLHQWNWEGTIDDFLLYWFEGEKEFNESVVTSLAQLRSQGHKVYIVSDNEEQRVKYLESNTDLLNYVDGGFYSYQLGFKKSEPDFFQKVLSELELTAEDVIYIDDDPHNIEIAEKINIDGVVYEDGMELGANLN